MGDWAAHRLIIFLALSLLMAGCTSITQTTPTAYPLVTLTVGRLFPVRTPPTSEPARTPAVDVTPTPPPIAVSVDVQHGDARDFTPPPTLPPLHVGSPTCYATPAGGTLCLGRIDNPLQAAVDTVAVDVRLWSDGPTPVAQQVAAVEQLRIPSGGFAPYSALFDAPWDAGKQASATLNSARVTADVASGLIIEAERAEQMNTRYIVAATLLNDADATTTPRAVVTVLNPAGEVVGYRVASLSRIDPGGRAPLRVEVVPLVDAPGLYHHLYVEALSDDA